MNLEEQIWNKVERKYGEYTEDDKMYFFLEEWEATTGTEHWIMSASHLDDDDEFFDKLVNDAFGFRFEIPAAVVDRIRRVNQ
jgi:hypothetical protein